MRICSLTLWLLSHGILAPGQLMYDDEIYDIASNKWLERSILLVKLSQVIKKHTKHFLKLLSISEDKQLG